MIIAPPECCHLASISARCSFLLRDQQAGTVQSFSLQGTRWELADCRTWEPASGSESCSFFPQQPKMRFISESKCSSFFQQGNEWEPFQVCLLLEQLKINSVLQDFASETLLVQFLTRKKNRDANKGGAHRIRTNILALISSLI
jgi:hypothetical protein